LSRVYDLFVSGGRDSVVAATIAFEEAKQLGIPARVVFINELPAFKVPEDILPFNPLDYVRTFSKWLGVDLVVLEPRIDYWEGVKKWGYPRLFHNRWCFRIMKMEVLKEFVVREVKEGYTSRTWVLGIRVNESTFRKRLWAEALKSNRLITTVGGYRVELYLPIATWGEKQIESFIKERGIPRNPAWDFGWSFECLCMAGTPLRDLDRIIAYAPRLAMWLAERDREVQASRREGPAYIATLIGKRTTLYEYIEKKLRQPKLTSWLNQEGSSEDGEHRKV
jgi:3'-phosphoadenosine 5'-phosphosulfate sulfotransferase (PAPS reductase)/FAD synthetase